MIYPDDMALHHIMTGAVGRSWRPANGSEGDMWRAAACGPCFWAGICSIEDRAMASRPGDDDYPSQWQIGPDGQPMCTDRGEVQ